MAMASLTARSRRTAGSSANDDYEGLNLIMWRMRVIPPNSWFRSIWDWVLITLVLYNLVAIPIEICFPHITPTPLAIFNFIVDTLFMIDLGLNFRTAYYLGAGLTPVIEPRSIYKHYLFGSTGRGVGWFWPDAIAAIPFDWVPVSTLQQTTFLSFAKLGRLFRLGRVFKKLDQFTAARAVRVMTLLVVVLLATHTFGCIWWKVGQDTGEEGWMYRDMKVVRALLHYDPFDSSDPLLVNLVDGTVNKTHLQRLVDDVPMEKKYLTALYWALTMVMKSPWFGPSMANEQIFACVFVVLGAMLFAAFIGNFTTAIVAFDKSNALYRDSIGTLRHFFKMRPHMSMETKRKTFRYAETYFKQTVEGVPEHAVLASMPEHLRPTVLLELHHDLISACSWLQETSFACCCDFLLCLRPEVVLRGDRLLRAGVISRNFYILMSGELQVTFPPEGARLSKLAAMLGDSGLHVVKAASNQRTSQRIPQGRIERMGSLIGWGAPHGLPRPLAYTAAAVRDSSLLSVSRSKLAEVLEAHPFEAAIFMRASEHASKLINPLKQGHVADDDADRQAAIHAKSRASTSEMLGESSVSMGPSRAAAQRKSVQPSRNVRNSMMENSVSSSESDAKSLSTAVESGWLRGSSPTPQLSTSAGAREGNGNGSPTMTDALHHAGSLTGLSQDEKLAVIFDEVMAMKFALAEQAAETTALRKMMLARMTAQGDPMAA